MLVTAKKAVGSLCSPVTGSIARAWSGRSTRATSIRKTRMIYLSGTLFFSVTRRKNSEPGKAPSRAMAKPMRVVTVMLEKPAKKRSMQIITAIAIAPALR